MLIRLAYLLPFSYFWVTRLRNGSIGFHLLFEWLAAAVVVVALDPANAADGLCIALLSYLAFISLYEIGYIANDLFAARKEADGRLRGPQGTPLGWVAGWVLARLAVFALVSYVLHKAGDVMWWALFGGLAVVFAMHNHLRERELKAGTFLWLSWYRFMAPIMFAVPVAYLPGIAFGCAITYSAFRQFGYLDSKGLLVMPGRKRPVFRWSFFMWPLLAAVVLAPIAEARGYVVLVVYFAVVASVGAVAMYARERRGRGPDVRG